MRRLLRLAALAATLLAILPAASAASAACRPGHIVERSRQAVVYWRTEPHPNPDQNPPVRAYYGCAFKTGKPVRLIRRTAYDHMHDLTLAGRSVAFATWFEDGAAAEVIESIRVWDLQDGRHKFIRPLSADEREPGRGEEVRSLVLKPNGSVAWVVAFQELGDPEYTYQVNSRETWTTGRRTKHDQSKAIRPRSLALSEDGRFVYWMHGATARSARIR